MGCAVAAAVIGARILINLPPLAAVEQTAPGARLAPDLDRRRILVDTTSAIPPASLWPSTIMRLRVKGSLDAALQVCL
jgi:hypothetical protein